MDPGISVIVPICHGGRFLHTALSTLVETASPSGGFEILIVGNHQDITIAGDVMNSSTVPVRFISHSGNRSSALNAACTLANGEIWAFTDDDCIIPRDWLLRIEHAMQQHPGAAAIGGSDRLPQDSGLFDLSLDRALNSFAATGGIRNAARLNAGRYYPKLWNMAVRAGAARRAASKDQVFNPLLDVHEDVELADRIIRNGGRILHVPDITVGHYRDTTFPSFFSRNLRMGQVCRAQGIHRSVHAAAAGFFMALLAAGVTAPFFIISMWVFRLLFGGYTVILAASGLSAAWSARRPALTVTVPFLIFTLHAARVIGFLHTVIARRVP